MSCTNRFAAAAALVGLLGVSSLTVPAAAQNQASIDVLASVDGNAPLMAQGVNALNFGVATAGTPKTPASLATDAGRFTISGQPSTPVTVSFQLPERLTGAASTWIPITFGVNDGLLWAPYSTAYTTFDPRASFFTNMDALGNLIIGISGTVSPPSGSITGNYTGTITLTVTY